MKTKMCDFIAKSYKLTLLIAVERVVTRAIGGAVLDKGKNVCILAISEYQKARVLCNQLLFRLCL